VKDFSRSSVCRKISLLNKLKRGARANFSSKAKSLACLKNAS